MASSINDNVPLIMSWITQINGRSATPFRMLDVGCGFCKWGLLVRSVIDVHRHGMDKENWKNRIDALEIYEPYIREMHRYLYNNIYIGDFRDHEDYNYDLVLFGDVLEHVSKEDGQKALRRVIKQAKNTIVSAPNYKDSQGTRHGNVYETHLSFWTPEDFRKISPKGEFKVAGRLNTVWYKR